MEIPASGMSITGGFSACFNQTVLLFWKPSLIHNTQFAIDLTPVPNGGSPSFRGFKCSQITGFQQRCIAWKYASLAVQLSIGGIQRFDRIGCVNDLPDFWGKLENRTDGIPVLLPASHRIRIFHRPFSLTFSRASRACSSDGAW